MESEYSFQFTEKAREDLDEAMSYMAVTLGTPKSAEAFLNKVEQTIEDLCLFPKSGPVINNEYVKTDSIIRRKAVGNYLLYYLPDEQTRILSILRIVYGKRDLETILRELD